MMHKDEKVDSGKVTALLIISSGCTMAGLGWGGIYAYFGLYKAMYLPWVFSVVVGLALVFYYFLKTYRVLLIVQLIMILTIPVLLQWVLGGFYNSGTVLLWSLMAPFGSIILQSARGSIFWIFSYLALVLISLFFDSYFNSLALDKVSHDATTFFFGMNIIAVSMVTFIAIYYYMKVLNNEKENKENYSRYLNVNVDRILNSIETMASGNLTASIDEQSGDETILRLFTGYNNATGMLKNSFRELRESAGSVSLSIVHISESIEKLSSGITRHSSQINDIENYIAKIQQDIIASSNAIQESSERSMMNVRYASEGGAIISETVSKIEEISREMVNAGHIIGKLEKDSIEIDEIIGAINDIADKTSLLSLNASIEAARAGEHGHGFAVVAAEIGKLTDVTTGSTREISAKLVEIQDKSKQAAEIVTRSNLLMNDGLKSAQQIGVSIKEIISISSKVNEIIEALHRQSGQQTDDIKEISRNIISLLSEIKVFLNDLNKINEYSTTMTGIAHSMEKSLEKFKLE